MRKSFYDWCIENDKEFLLAEWDFEKNRNLQMKEVGFGSDKKVWWVGKCNHKWLAAVKHRVRGTNCPLCYEENTGRKVVKRRQLNPGINDFATEHPELLKEWDFNKNEGLLPSDCMSGSHKKVWWVCPKCHQSYQSSPSNRIRGRECSNKVCRKIKQVANIKKVLVERRGSLLKHNPELANEWHPFKNGDLTPDKISPASDVKVWWLGLLSRMAGYSKQ